MQAQAELDRMQEAQSRTWLRPAMVVPVSVVMVGVLAWINNQASPGHANMPLYLLCVLACLLSAVGSFVWQKGSALWSGVQTMSIMTACIFCVCVAMDWARWYWPPIAAALSAAGQR
jgi:hypothetical protein